MGPLIRSGYKAYYYLCYFITYSFLGWLTETVYVSVTEHRIAARGFLYGPFCPVYGFGVLLILCFLQPLRRNKLIVFVTAVLFSSVLEYITGYMLETAFNSRWWDYSHDFLNLQGRICLKASLAWGLASFIVLHFIHPAVRKWVEGIPVKFRVYVAYFVLLYFVVDFSVSVRTLVGPGTFTWFISLLYPFAFY